MKKSLIFLILLAGLFLTGCDDENQERMDDSENIEQEDVSNIEQEDVSNNEINQSTKPPKLGLSLNNNLILTTRYSYCWGEVDCSLEQKDPEEVTIGGQPKKVTPSQPFTFVMHSTVPEEGSPKYPDVVEVTQIRQGKETQIDVTNKQIIAPEEVGVYYYNVHAKWESERQGEAYYAFKISVRN